VGSLSAGSAKRFLRELSVELANRACYVYLATDPTERGSCLGEASVQRTGGRQATISGPSAWNASNQFIQMGKQDLQYGRLIALLIAETKVDGRNFTP
jgi:hypothetical protein